MRRSWFFQNDFANITLIAGLAGSGEAAKAAGYAETLPACFALHRRAVEKYQTPCQPYRYFPYAKMQFLF
jgi:hypothetical protein